MKKCEIRTQARLNGETHYFTGKPCKNGHVANRFVSNYCCVICSDEMGRIWETKNADRVAETRSIYAEKHKDKINRKSLDWYYANKEKCAARVKEWSAANKDKRNEATKIRRAANPEKTTADSKRSYERNKEKRKEEARLYRLNNKDRIWQVKFPEKAKESRRRWNSTEEGKLYKVLASQKRRAVKKAAAGNITKEDLRRITEAQGGKCAYCQKKTKLTLDHIVAISKGGEHMPRNVQMLCGSCNSKKHDKDPLIYARQIGLLL